jgi:hypothetical protein
MVFEERALSPRCGSYRYERITETDSRCAECGLGRRSQPLGAWGPPPGAPPRVPSPDEARLRLQMQRMMESADSPFRDATFEPFGLDDQWTGLRSIGGQGSSNGVTTSITLAHGDLPRRGSGV